MKKVTPIYGGQMKFNSTLKLGSVLCAAMLISACSSDNEPKKQAPKAIEDSFQKPATELSTGNPATAKQGEITLKKSSIGKAFLMSPAMIVAHSAPILDHLQPLVVSFERNGDQLAMYELNTMSYYKDIPSDKLLHTFKVSSEDSDSITFKWEYGPEFISGKSLDYMTDYGGSGDVTGPTEDVYPAEKTFVKQIKIEDNTLQIEQVSRIRVQSMQVNLIAVLMGQPLQINASDLTVTTYFRLTPYSPNAGFEAKKSELDKGIGFFEQITYDLKNQKDLVVAKKWAMGDKQKPLVYAITKNVPENMAQAVADGVLYWNKVLGYEAVKVEMGADPMELPRDRRVLIHWIDWKAAGFARASMQADPLTGELIGGNVYMTSVFAEGGEISARVEGDLGNKTTAKNNKNKESNKKAISLSLKGFNESATCSLNPAASYQAAVAKYPVSGAQALKAAQDYVTSTVAHEVGHTLGLRHNFAASTEGEIKDSKDLEAKTKTYLTTENHPGYMGASSVMDYDGGMVSSMVGAYIKHNALPYDSAAMKWAYTDSKKSAEELNPPMFCTDGHINPYNALETYLGCERFDTTQNPLEAKVAEVDSVKNNLIQKFYMRLVMKLNPKNPQDKMNLKDLVNAVNGINLAERAATMASGADDVKTSMLLGKIDYKVQSVFGKPGFLNEDIYLQTNFELMSASYQSFGGLMGLINRALPLDPQTGMIKKDWLQEQTAKFLASPAATAGTTWEGVDYKLSSEEASFLKGLTEAYAANMAGLYVGMVLDGMTLADDAKTTFASFLMGDELQIELSEFVQKHLLAVKKDVLPVTINGKTVELSLAEYSSGLRNLMLRWLSPKRMGDRKWAKATRTQLKEEMVKRLQILTGSTSDSASDFKSEVKKLDLDDKPLAWANAEISVLEAIEELDGEVE